MNNQIEPDGYIYHNQFYSSIEDLKGQTFSDGFVPVPVYFAPMPEGFWEKAYSLLTHLWELHNEGKEGTEEYEKAQIYWESHVCYHEPNIVTERYTWKDPFTDPPEIGVEVLCFSPKWIDEDFNPDGIRIGFRDDLSGWTTAKWCNTHDEYHTRTSDEDDMQYQDFIAMNQIPTLWCPIQKPIIQQ